MSDPKNEEPKSIFDGADEEPEEGVNTIDERVVPGDEETTREVSEDGQLKMSVPVGDIDPYDHSAEQDALDKKRAEDGTAPPPMPETAPEPERNPAMMQNSNEPLQEEMERRFSQDFGDLKIEVEVGERDAFVRCAAHDEEFLLDIELEGVGVVVTIAIPPDEFTNSAAAAVGKWGAADVIDAGSDLQWLLAFQQVHAWFQVRAIDGTPTPWSDYWADGMPPIKQLREDMQNLDYFEPFFQMNAVRWRMMLDSIRIAELKYKICMQNWKDRSFFGGADIG